MVMGWFSGYGIAMRCCRWLWGGSCGCIPSGGCVSVGTTPRQKLRTRAGRIKSPLLLSPHGPREESSEPPERKTRPSEKNSAWEGTELAGSSARWCQGQQCPGTEGWALPKAQILTGICCFP